MPVFNPIATEGTRMITTSPSKKSRTPSTASPKTNRSFGSGRAAVNSQPAAKRPPKQANGAPARQNGVGSLPPVAPAPGHESKNGEPPPLPDYDTILANFRAANMNAEQPVQSKLALPNFGRLPEIAARMGQILESQAAPPSPPKPTSATLLPAPRVQPVSHDVLGVSLSVGMLVSAMSTAVGAPVDPAVVYQLLENMIDASGMRGDPMGSIMVEQILLMRIVSGNLHALTLLGSTAGEKSIVNSSAINISAELRRMIIALQAYRTGLDPARSKTKSKASPKNADLRDDDLADDDPTTS